MRARINILFRPSDLLARVANVLNPRGKIYTRIRVLYDKRHVRGIYFLRARVYLGVRRIYFTGAHGWETFLCINNRRVQEHVHDVIYAHTPSRVKVISVNERAAINPVAYHVRYNIIFYIIITVLYTSHIIIIIVYHTLCRRVVRTKRSSCTRPIFNRWTFRL